MTVALALGAFALLALVFMLIRKRDPLDRAAEHAAETGDDAELVALMRLRYPPKDASESETRRREGK